MDSWVFSVIDVVCPKRIKYNLSVLEVSETEVSSLVKHICKCQIRPSKYHQNVPSTKGWLAIAKLKQLSLFISLF